MSDADSTPKMVSAPIRMSPELAAKVEEAKRLTGLAQADILRLCLAIGLEDLKRVGFDLPKVISMTARPDITAVSGNTIAFGEAKAEWEKGDAAARGAENDPMPPATAERQPRFEIMSVGGIAAGSQMANHEIRSQIRVGKQYPADHYALEVFGKSMEPTVPDRSYIVVKPWKDGYPRKGTIVVYNDGHGVTLKQYDTRKARAGDEAGEGRSTVPVLRSINPDFPNVETMEGGRIVAVLVEVLPG